MRKGFGRDRLEDAFKRIGEALAGPVEAFMLGGGAMCFRGQKAATKDLDLIFRARKDEERFAAALRKLGFSETTGNVETAYEEMKAVGIWEDSGGFRLDLFVNVVCGALSLSGGMVKRSQPLAKYGKLSVLMVSNEDVILFKGITERARDEEDIEAIIKRADIDWEIVMGECVAQSGTRHWYGPFYNKLADLKENRGIAVPILDRLLRLDQKVILKSAFETRLQKGMGRKEAIEELEKLGFTKEEIEEAA